MSVLLAYFLEMASYLLLPTYKKMFCYAPTIFNKGEGHIVASIKGNNYMNYGYLIVTKFATEKMLIFVPLHKSNRIK